MHQSAQNNDPLYQRFNIHLKENFSEIADKKLLLAVSGGVDSMVMLDLFSKTGAHISLAHCNFKLRAAESDKDEAFVQAVANDMDIPLHHIQFDTKAFAARHKCSIQMAARDLRYEWFQKIMDTYHYDFLLTAHHAEDNLETFFINLSRGTGIDGLCGIPEKANRILRPLLPFSKEDIKVYAMKQGLIWREDQSNQDTKYLRNKIRMELVPLLKELNPAFLDTFGLTIKNLQGAQDVIDDAMKDIRKQVVIKEKKAGVTLYRFKIEELLKFAHNTAYLYQLFSPFGFHQWKDIKTLMLTQTGKQLFSDSHRMVKDRGDLLVTRIPEATVHGVKLIKENDTHLDVDNCSLRLEKGGFHEETTHGLVHRNKEQAIFDYDRLIFPLSVRKWKKGDYFYPLGMRGKKKLSKYFKDEKFSLLQKENIWLLCSGEDIIWIIGKRMDDRFKVTSQTTTIFKATLQT